MKKLETKQMRKQRMTIFVCILILAFQFCKYIKDDEIMMMKGQLLIDYCLSDKSVAVSLLWQSSLKCIITDGQLIIRLSSKYVEQIQKCSDLFSISVSMWQLIVSVLCRLISCHLLLVWRSFFTTLSALIVKPNLDMIGCGGSSLPYRSGLTDQI